MIRVGFLGMGYMGTIHAANLQKMPGVQISALCSAPADHAKEFAEKNGLNCGVYEDGFKMLKEAEMDALYICLPPFAHSGQLEEAAEKGIHIFIEKPIALNLQRAKSMVSAVTKARVHTQVGYHMRFGGAVQKFMEMYRSGRTGKITLFSAAYECNSLHGSWWRDLRLCGGQVFEQVIHLYDMAFYMLGKPVSVSGHIANLLHKEVEGYTVEDTSVASLMFDSGALGSITGSNCAVKNFWSARFRVVCENMIADFEDFNHAKIIHTGGDEPLVEEIVCDTDAVMTEDIYFIDVLNGRQKPFATIGEGLTGLRMVSGVVESAKTNTIVKL
jgi:predicted dehydrogenase